MRTFVLFLAGLALAASFFAAEPRSSKPAATSKLLIDNKGGVELSAGRIVFRDQVQVYESDMYMECELLTLLQQTNTSVKTPSGGSITNLSVRPDIIIAETNLMMMARGTTIIGDRAVYTTSNETVVITGDPVIIERADLLMYATNCVYNRLANHVSFIGPTETELTIKGGATGTNSLLPGFGTPRQNGPSTSPRSGNAK